MRSDTRLAVAVLLAPLVISLLTGALMMHTTGRDKFPQSSNLETRPLNLRIDGYTASDVVQYWDAIGPEAFDAERSFLKADLAYPLAYGGSLLAALVLVLQRRQATLWLAAPVVVTMVADWVENSIQLGQLSAYVAHAPLNSSLIAVSSAATQIKWVSLILAFGFLVQQIIMLARNKP